MGNATETKAAATVVVSPDRLADVHLRSVAGTATHSCWDSIRIFSVDCRRHFLEGADDGFNVIGTSGHGLGQRPVKPGSFLLDLILEESDLVLQRGHR